MPLKSFAFSSSSHFKANLLRISYHPHSLIDSYHITLKSQYICAGEGTPLVQTKSSLWRPFYNVKITIENIQSFFGFVFETLFHPSQSSCSFASCPSSIIIMFNWTCHTSTLKIPVAAPNLGPKCTIVAWHSSVPWCRAMELLLHIVNFTLLCRSWI